MLGLEAAAVEAQPLEALQEPPEEKVR